MHFVVYVDDRTKNFFFFFFLSYYFFLLEGGGEWRELKESEENRPVTFMEGITFGSDTVSLSNKHPLRLPYSSVYMVLNDMCFIQLKQNWH